MGLLLWRGRAQPKNIEAPLVLQLLHFELFELYLQEIRTDEPMVCGFVSKIFFYLILFIYLFYRLMQPTNSAVQEFPPAVGQLLVLSGRHVLPLLWNVKKKM